MATGASRDQRRWLLVLALIAGLLSMHALVIAGHDGNVGLGATAHDTAAEPTAGPLMAAQQLPADPLMLGQQAQLGHRTPAGPPDTDHGLLHLCLAVLAAIAVLLLGLAWLTTPEATLSRLRLHGPDAAPARPPPRSAVRLALLCVLRN